MREVAEALFWVHGQGIIHRDIKCANVLVAEDGRIQLCDFGVAGIMETTLDKRRTVTGTLQWMAPELFEPTVSYGTEVDIWAFGSMAYEVATGLPPNATSAAEIDFVQFSSSLKQQCPRLDGDRYSLGLKSLVAYCMVGDRNQRPTIKEVQRHPYIFNSAGEYPTASLSNLVAVYKLLELQGGIRRSLFSVGGAQGWHGAEQGSAAADEDWDFNTSDDTDQHAIDDPDAQTVRGVYGPLVNSLPQPPNPQPRRRRPAPNTRQVATPLERAFDSNTITSYRDNARVFYGRSQPPTRSSAP